MTKIITVSIIGIVISLAGLFLFLNGECWMFFSYLLSIVGFFVVVGICLDDDIDFIDRRIDITKIVVASIALVVSLYPFFCCFNWFVQIGSRFVSLLYGYETYSQTYEGGLIVFLASIGVASFFTFIIIDTSKNIVDERNENCKSTSKRSIERQEKAKEERALREKALSEQRAKEKQEIDELIAQYGALTKTITLLKLSQSKAPAHSIMIFDTTSTIIIRRKAFSYRDILNCTVADNSTTTQSSSTLTSNTTTDTGSMLGRAIVGGVLTGGVGAVVGAATAKKKTTTSSPQVNIVVKHDYTIQINVNSITEALIKIHIGADEDKVNEIVSVLNVIISRNSQVNN